MTPSPIEIKKQLLLRLINDHGLEPACEEIASQMVVMEQRIDGFTNLSRMTVRYLDENE